MSNGETHLWAARQLLVVLRLVVALAVAGLSETLNDEKVFRAAISLVQVVACAGRDCPDWQGLRCNSAWRVGPVEPCICVLLRLGVKSNNLAAR